MVEAAASAETKSSNRASYKSKMNSVTKLIPTVVCVLSCLAAPGVSAAGQNQPPATPQNDPLVRVDLPPVTVNAQKEPADLQKLPVSVTAVTADTIDNAGLRTVSEASVYAPNSVFTDFTARKLSNARFRGIGSSPANPAITTYLDGVPQLNANSSNVDLVSVQQIEFVRGPQSALFGRNALGGVVNVTSRKPAFGKWTGNVVLPIGNYSAFDLRGTASGTLIEDTLSAGFGISLATRDGFTVNSVSGDDLDSRSSFTGKGQLLWKPVTDWEARVIIGAERARDGDYGFHDLASLRENPRVASRNFEGFTHRDIFNTTILTEHKGSFFTLTTTTGLVDWKTEDSTDLDYSAFPLATRDNAEDAFQFTQEVRFASAKPATLPREATLAWQAGVFFFNQDYQQDAVNHVGANVIPQVPFAVNQYSPVASLNDAGLGIFGHGTLALSDRLNVIAGARFDHESKDADLKTFFDPAIAPPVVVEAEQSFSNFSPQISATYQLQPQQMVYATLSRGFKAGGFNPASPAGSEAYDEETSWNLEGGIKTRWLNDRVSVNAAIFSIDWNDLQLNLPNVQVPNQFFIANVGGASSRGFEIEAAAKAAPGVDLFTGFGYTRARFGDDTTAFGANVSDNKVPYTPDYTFNLGVQYGRAITSDWTAYGRAEVTLYGAFSYDELNLQEQEGYSLANLRGGIRGKRFFGEGWIRNAFDTNYIPVAIPLQFAPSGYIGESGAPRTFGISVGVTF
jgi:iron complex outermembrane receptor protein